MVQFYFLADFGTADAFIEFGDHIAIEVDTTEHKMAVRMSFIEMSCHDILSVCDTHVLQPLVDQLRHEAVAMFVVGE